MRGLYDNASMKKTACSILLAIVVFPVCVTAQITIGGGAVVAARATITTNGDIANLGESSIVNLENVDLRLTGTDQQLSTALPGRLKIRSLTIDGGGEKRLAGQWEVTSRLHLLNGILTPEDDRATRLVFSAITENQESIIYSDSAFVNGYLYSVGNSFRTFPIGYARGEVMSAPVVLASIPAGQEVGVRVVNGNSGLVGTIEIEEVLNTRFWEIDAAVPVNSRISLSDKGLSPDNAWVVVQGPSRDAAAEILGGGADNAGFVSSELPVTMPVVTLAIPFTFDIAVHDLITPYTADDANDVLVIENLHLTAENTVTLLDRWGVAHKIWKNYDSSNPGYDFRKLSPGNYICVVEYKLPGSSQTKKKSQMITVLRTN